MADVAHIDSLSPFFHVQDAIRELRAMLALVDASPESGKSTADQGTATAQAVVEGARRALRMLEQRETFSAAMTTPVSANLQEIEEVTKKHDWPKAKAEGTTMGLLKTAMMSGAVEGQFLKFLTCMHKARRVLEVGMLTGYSALSMAEALPSDGVVVTCELEPYLVKIAQELFSHSPHGSKIQIRQGSGKEVLSALLKEGQTFDIIFLDADKQSYIEYFKMALEGLLAPGGTLVADNAFRLGMSYSKPLDDAVANPMGHFVSHVAAHPGVSQVMLAMRDGVLLVRRNEDFDGEPAVSATC